MGATSGQDLHRKPPAIGGAGMAQGGQAFQQGLHCACAAPLELAGDLFGGGYRPPRSFIRVYRILEGA